MGYWRDWVSLVWFSLYVRCIISLCVLSLFVYYLSLCIHRFISLCEYFVLSIYALVLLNSLKSLRNSNSLVTLDQRLWVYNLQPLLH